MLTQRRDIIQQTAAILGFYLIFSLLYHIVLWYNSGSHLVSGLWSWINLREYLGRSGIQYGFILIASVITWFIGVRLFKGRSMLNQIIIVGLMIPVMVYACRYLLYAFYDYYGMGRLRGTGAVWDLYIPLLFMLFQFSFFFAYKSFIENQRKLKIEGELRQAALKSELAAIKAQLNPHFLYNVFNTINASVPAENEHTRNMIAQLSDLFRYQLQATRQDTVTLGEELEFVKKYLDLEKARFEERLRVVIDVPEEYLNEKVPPMILQPLVENSVKHGISNVIAGGTVSIKVFKEMGKLKFEIADTGVGAGDKNMLLNKGVGLTNTMLRLKKIYNSTLVFSDNHPSGLRVSFAI